MAGNARSFDLWAGICCCHPPIPCVGMAGPIITFSTDTQVNSRGQARMFDITIGFCGHSGVIVSSSLNTQVNSRGVARCFDVVVGCNIGVIVTCSSDTHTND